MNPHNYSLIEVLSPPMGSCLKQVSRRKADLPVCVRQVLFEYEDDVGFEPLA